MPGTLAGLVWRYLWKLGDATARIQYCPDLSVVGVGMPSLGAGLAAGDARDSWAVAPRRKVKRVVDTIVSLNYCVQLLGQRGCG